MDLERLIEEIIRVKSLSYADELEVVGDLIELLSHPNEVKERWYRINKMNQMRFCTYIIASGERKGDMCGKQIKTQDPYCSVHTIAVPKETSSVSSTSPKSSSLLLGRRAARSSTEIKFKGNSTLEEEKTDKSKSRLVIRDDDIIIHQNRYKNFVYPGTSLILDKDNIVVAKESERGDWLPLSPEDIRLAKRNKLRYRIIPFEFKGEKAPASMSGFLEKDSIERQDISDALQPTDLFVLKPKTHPDDIIKYNDD